MTRIFRYKLTTDNGMAPCINDGLVSLATCKPHIRASARPGDWVVGFRSMARGALPGIVIWAGRVAYNIEVGEYERQYRGRLDAVYRAKPGGRFKRLRPDYHPGEKEFRKDTTSPVLVFDRGATWYFGREPQMLSEHLMHLAPTVRDYRVNGVNDGDATALQTWLMSTGLPGVHGVPHEGSPTKPRRCYAQRDRDRVSAGVRCRRAWPIFLFSRSSFACGRDMAMLARQMGSDRRGHGNEDVDGGGDAGRHAAMGGRGGGTGRSAGVDHGRHLAASERDRAGGRPRRSGHSPCAGDDQRRHGPGGARRERGGAQGDHGGTGRPRHRSGAIVLLPPTPRMGFIGNEANDPDLPRISPTMAAAMARKTAQSMLQISFGDPALVGRVREVLDERNQALGGPPIYALKDDRPARDAAIADGLARARREAEAYAAPLGLRVGRIARISNYGDTAQTGPDIDFLTRMMAGAQDNGPSNVTTRAPIWVDFELVPR